MHWRWIGHRATGNAGSGTGAGAFCTSDTAYTSAMMLQMLAQHSTHAKSALAIRAGDCVASIGQLAHAASDHSQEAN